MLWYYTTVSIPLSQGEYFQYFTVKYDVYTNVFFIDILHQIKKAIYYFASNIKSYEWVLKSIKSFLYLCINFLLLP